MDFPTIDPSAFDGVEGARREPKYVHEVTVQRLDLTFPEDSLELIKRKYPRIYKQVIMMWGSKELQIRLTHLTLVDQDGRRGWDADVADALVKIALHHEALFKYDVMPNWSAPRDRW